MTTATYEMFRLFTADCEGSYLQSLSKCSLYKETVFRRAETELQGVEVPDEDACSSSKDTVSLIGILGWFPVRFSPSFGIGGFFFHRLY